MITLPVEDELLITLTWFAGSFQKECIAFQTIEKYEFVLDLSKDVEIICEDGRNLFFDPHPFNLKQWVDEYYKLVHPDDDKIIPFLERENVGILHQKENKIKTQQRNDTAPPNQNLCRMPLPMENFLESSPHKAKTPPTMSLADLYNLNAESSPPDRTKYKCKTKNCNKMAVYAHNKEPDDAPVFCTTHAKNVPGTYPPSKGLLH
jgi:hypothetical protein